MLRIKRKESHNNLEDTLAKNKVEKTALVREVSNLKNSVKILEKKNRKKNNNNERSELAKIPKIVSKKAPEIPINLEKKSGNVEEALKTDSKYNSSSADTNETEDENLKNLYNIPTAKNLFEILSDSDGIIPSSMVSINRNIPSRTTSLNPIIRINPDLKQDVTTSSAMDIAESSDTIDPHIAEEDSEVRVEENFEIENEEEDFSHLSPEEQAILIQISRIVKGSLSQ